MHSGLLNSTSVPEVVPLVEFALHAWCPFKPGLQPRNRMQCGAEHTGRSLACRARLGGSLRKAADCVQQQVRSISSTQNCVLHALEVTQQMPEL